MRVSILYLDDEAGCLAVFYETFRREYDVRTALTAEEALLMLEERPAEIVVGDYVMSDVTGTEFLRDVAAA